jgi:GT2 family glycosyltransferase
MSQSSPLIAHRSPLVSVLILNYGAGRSAVECVKALQKQSIADQLEIIVIDNHSCDDSIGILRTNLRGIKNVRIVETPGNHGFGYGYNKGVQYARGKYLLINNPDKRLEPTGLEKLVHEMDRDSTIGILGPKLVHPDGTRRLSIRRDPRLIDLISRRSIAGKVFDKALDRYLMLSADSDKIQDVDWVVGGCFLISREFFTALDGFDARFFLFFEDADLCRRCRTHGKRVVYFPLVQALDRPRRLSGESFWDLISTRIGRIHMVSALQYFWKWRGGEKVR